MSDRRKEIKRLLREISRDPSAPGAAAEAQRLTAEYRRLSRPQRAPAVSRAVVEPKVSDPDAEAIATWPPELRNRPRDGALTRLILPWRE
ncbi:hypothetical protein [Streptomyces sp. bgisy034]|uniref:hypothetical protein n=1 Tax=Streptomyces sp. bgisy034 TaxID=3413774 RepID=UPI003EBB4D06